MWSLMSESILLPVFGIVSDVIWNIINWSSIPNNVSVKPGLPGEINQFTVFLFRHRSRHSHPKSQSHTRDWASPRIPRIPHFSHAVLFRTTAFPQPHRPSNIPFPHSPSVQNNEFCFWCELYEIGSIPIVIPILQKVNSMRCLFWNLSEI